MYVVLSYDILFLVLYIYIYIYVCLQKGQNTPKSISDTEKKRHPPSKLEDRFGMGGSRSPRLVVDPERSLRNCPGYPRFFTKIKPPMYILT